MDTWLWSDYRHMAMVTIDILVAGMGVRSGEPPGRCAVRWGAFGVAGACLPGRVASA
jgi:hypothetical protein